jgi:hypothetical protein
MNVPTFLSSFVSSQKLPSLTKPSNNRRLRKPLNYQQCERRDLLAGIDFSAATGQILIGGTSGNDRATVSQLGNTINVTQQGFESRSFNAKEVQSILFVGLAGDDYFENRTATPSIAFGQLGNDTLIGGSNADRLFGNSQDDRIVGGGGDDFLVAGIGNDRIDGGHGNDRILGIHGKNLLNGDSGDDIIFGGLGEDEIAGSSGDDTLVGNSGDDSIHGGGGNDLIFGGKGNDNIFGNSGSDRIYGQGDNDRIFGGNGDDVVAGNDGDDQLSGERGNDRVVGGQGNDLANFSGDLAKYRVQESGSNLRITDTRNSFFDLSDVVIGAEQINFADDVVSPEEALAGPAVKEALSVASKSIGVKEIVIIQPIIAANSDGSNIAEFFGNAQQEADIKAQVDQIFSQADIEVQFLPAKRINDSAINVGTEPNVRPRGDLGKLVSSGDIQGVGNPDSRVVDAYFVERTPGFEMGAENSSAGLAFIGRSGLAVHVGDNLVNSSIGRELVARVVSHEIAHNLGLRHTDQKGNLMTDQLGATNLNRGQIDLLIESRLSLPV